MAKNTLNLAEMTVDALQSELVSLRAAYQDGKFDHAVRGLANPMELREQRRVIARYNTELRSREVAAMSPEQVALRSKLRNRRKRGA